MASAVFFDPLLSGGVLASVGVGEVTTAKRDGHGEGVIRCGEEGKQVGVQVVEVGLAGRGVEVGMPVRTAGSLGRRGQSGRVGGSGRDGNLVRPYVGKNP